ncbi:hypothetical protein [Hymenobacter daeguensis]
MPRHFYVAIASLGLLLGACKKSTPAPKPSLEGSWNNAYTVTTAYSAAGLQTSQNTYTYPQGTNPAARYITFTGTTYQIFSGAGVAQGPPEGYTRYDDLLTFASGTPTSSTIKQLTATDLTLLGTMPTPQTQGDYTTYEVHYTRR